MAESPDVANSGFWTDSERSQVIARIIKKTGIEPNKVFEAEGYSDKLGRVVGHYIPANDALHTKLNAAAMQYQLDVYWANKPSNSNLIKALDSIESGAARILKALRLDLSVSDPLEAVRPLELRFALQGQAIVTGERIGGFPNHPPVNWGMRGQTYKDWQGKEQLRDVIFGINQLMSWAHEAKKRKKERANRPRSMRNIGNVPQKKLLLELCIIWQECFGRMPSVSRNATSGIPTGPFLRFAVAAFEEMGVSISSEALATRFQRLMGKSGKKKVDPPISTA
jgi:hypothetical protein